jgi:hypothetical protein
MNWKKPFKLFFGIFKPVPLELDAEDLDRLKKVHKLLIKNWSRSFARVEIWRDPVTGIDGYSLEQACSILNNEFSPGAVPPLYRAALV